MNYGFHSDFSIDDPTVLDPIVLDDLAVADGLEYQLNIPKGVSPDDPFRYGWRYIEKVAADGTIEYDQIPLTLEDLLHPEGEDFRMQNPKHNDTCLYLKVVLSKQMADTPDALILQDMRVDWNVPGIRLLDPILQSFWKAISNHRIRVHLWRAKMASHRS